MVTVRILTWLDEHTNVRQPLHASVFPLYIVFIQRPVPKLSYEGILDSSMIPLLKRYEKSMRSVNQETVPRFLFLNYIKNF